MVYCSLLNNISVLRTCVNEKITSAVHLYNFIHNTVGMLSYDSATTQSNDWFLFLLDAEYPFVNAILKKHLMVNSN